MSRSRWMAITLKKLKMAVRPFVIRTGSKMKDEV